LSTIKWGFLGGKSSLSGSGSYNNGLGNKTSVINEPISEGYQTNDKITELKQSKSADDQHLISVSIVLRKIHMN